VTTRRTFPFKTATGRLSVALGLCIALAGIGWTYVLVLRTDNRELTQQSSSRLAAADRFRDVADSRTDELVSALQHLTPINSNYAGRIVDLTTPANNDHRIANLVVKMNSVLADWELPDDQLAAKLGPLQQQYAAAIHRDGDFTYTTAPAKALGEVTLNGTSYWLDYDNVDGFPAVVLRER
jgi:hypothetical protein